MDAITVNLSDSLITHVVIASAQIARIIKRLFGYIAKSRDCFHVIIL